MPPSRCCTVLTLVSTLITPGATTALSSGASIDQTEKAPRKAAMIPRPSSVWPSPNGGPATGAAGGGAAPAVM